MWRATSQTHNSSKKKTGIVENLLCLQVFCQPDKSMNTVVEYVAPHGVKDKLSHIFHMCMSNLSKSLLVSTTGICNTGLVCYY